ncbi:MULTISPECIES: hypothetical protein [Mogibacterium]|uniref:Uncharacterized protein n=1 Tax=Mogibacterium timidum ATCC 33093 TaxID=1401079 RepID=X8IW24_9FIRM|nr:MULTISPECIES: hypothetical protein [Mogibacterium]EUC53404.1 hypothetical protein HMPREF0581_0785 [Mogibacterium timidum ATCC 33093]
MIALELILYCLLFTMMVRYAVRGGAIDGLYFYPKIVQERAIEIGLTTKEVMQRKKKIFMTEFYIIMLVALVLIIGVLHRVSDFKTAYLLALLFLEVMNWYDGIVIDKIWVGHSKFWILAGCEELPFVQTWKQVLKKRGLLTLIWIVGAVIVAEIVALIF